MGSRENSRASQLVWGGGVGEGGDAVALSEKAS